MDVYFESRCPDGDQLRVLAVRRTHAATHRIVNPVSRVKVQLTNIPQAGSSADKRCRVEFSIGNSGAIVASADASDPFAAAHSAAPPRATCSFRHPSLRQGPGSRTAMSARLLNPCAALKKAEL
jgi:hypothetical protein